MVSPVKNLPDNTPKPIGEYANKPTFSRAQISEEAFSNKLFKANTDFEWFLL
jgi:hypothetical protein